MLSRPFLKWAGGKTRLLNQYKYLFPNCFRAYHEPFLGSGAIFFKLKSINLIKTAQLGDRNSELVNCYRMVRDALSDVILELSKHQLNHSKEYFYNIRSLDPVDLDQVARAGRTIYLNKTCFNGLFRLNRQGKFNVPFGRYSRPSILNINTLTSASLALEGTTLVDGDYRYIIDRAQLKDFVYIDPPYYPTSKTANFTSYTAAAFTEIHQRELATIVKDLTNSGVSVMISNSDTHLIRELYKDFYQHRVQTSRSINSNPSKRGNISELLITNYKTGT
ncbi:DNA adenine methylase [SAR202 cluster bacterium AC-409-J13_OGT_754m]|nr:DNA adenine methylase [SAR202 cluster bacterium AC-409-J13_OGT_754m]